MAPRFFLPDAREPGQIVPLRGEEFHHLRSVLRMQAGDEVALFDGAGRGFAGRIVGLGAGEARIQVGREESPSRESGLCLVLIAALSKGEKFELVIQKTTELGVTSVEPVYTEHTDIRSQPGRDERKVGRWRKIALEACKQSGRSRVPTVHSPVDLPEALAGRREALCLVMDPEGAAPDSDWLQRLAGVDSAAMAVGPEGGWSPEERRAFHAAGFHALRLGPRVLRTETAAIVSTAILQFLVGDLGTGPVRKAHPDAIRDS